MNKKYQCRNCKNFFTNFIDLNYHSIDCENLSFGKLNRQEEKNYDWLEKQFNLFESKLPRNKLSNPSKNESSMSKLVKCCFCSVWAEPSCMYHHHRRKHPGIDFVLAELELEEDNSTKFSNRDLVEKLEIEKPLIKKGKNKSSASVQKPKKSYRNDKISCLSKNNLICVLCGEIVPRGQILEHKEKMHGEAKILPSPARKKSGNIWVSVFQGGLPGLGKRSR